MLLNGRDTGTMLDQLQFF
jgi:hypothetical protein